jgi:hypothetical protein
MICGVALLVNNHIVFHQERRALLDMRDAQIEAKYLRSALAGRPASETAGFVVAESSIRLMRRDADLKAAFSNLAPELSDMLDAKPDVGGAA